MVSGERWGVLHILSAHMFGHKFEICPHWAEQAKCGIFVVTLKIKQRFIDHNFLFLEKFFSYEA